MKHLGNLIIAIMLGFIIGWGCSEKSPVTNPNQSKEWYVEKIKSYLPPEYQKIKQRNRQLIQKFKG